MEKTSRGIAITRQVSRSIADCELSHLDRRPIDVDRAREQHDTYERALELSGWRIEKVELLEEHPDAVFVEDCAVVLGDVALIARPGAASRRGEVASVAKALGRHRVLHEIEAPATIDGGDVLVIGDRVFVGRSARTNAEGRRALRDFADRAGFVFTEVTMRDCLHLKTAVSAFAPDGVVVQPLWVDPEAFAPLRTVSVDEREPFAANVLWAGENVLVPRAHPRTADLLAGAGATVAFVDADELARAEGGLTCCSILLEDTGDPR